MTDQEINVAVAEACGRRICVHSPDKWERRGTDGDSELYCTGCQRYLHDMRVPKFCTDLNVMHEAEKTLEHPEAYASRLGPIIQRDTNQTSWTGSWGTTRWHFAFAHATARQRAEAFLRTLGKWKE